MPTSTMAASTAKTAAAAAEREAFLPKTTKKSASDEMDKTYTSTSSSPPSSSSSSSLVISMSPDGASPLPPPPQQHGGSASATTDAMKLLWGAGGIYAAFLYYGSLQEDVFAYDPTPASGSGGGGSEAGEKFTQVWFLQALEALANVVVGLAGLGLAATGARRVGGRAAPLMTSGAATAAAVVVVEHDDHHHDRTGNGTGSALSSSSASAVQMPKKYFVISGLSQVLAKAFTSLALASGLSFPVATLAKSAKMAPVMAGQLLYGGATYTAREYGQVGLIIGGTALLGLGKKKGGKSQSSSVGLIFILLSLTMDGVTAGVQKRLKADLAKVGVKPGPYDFMFWTNLYMMLAAIAISVALGELTSGLAYCASHPDILNLIVRFSVCSAIGQSFIFYTVAHFDPLVCSTVTTTRKIFSVLLSICTKGHRLSSQGWVGVTLAVSGILGEVHSKVASSKSRQLKTKDSLPLYPSGQLKHQTQSAGQSSVRRRLPLTSLDEEADESKGPRRNSEECH